MSVCIYLPPCWSVPISFIASHIYLSNKLIVCFYHPSECDWHFCTWSSTTVLCWQQSEKRAHPSRQKEDWHHIEKDRTWSTIYSPVSACLPAYLWLSLPPPNPQIPTLDFQPCHFRRNGQAHHLQDMDFLSLRWCWEVAMFCPRHGPCM